MVGSGGGGMMREDQEEKYERSRHDCDIVGACSVG